MKKLAVLLIVLAVAMFAVAACSKNSQSSSGGGSMATSNSMQSMSSSSSMAMSSSPLPIPLKKLPMAKVAPGNATAGAQAFSANCASCHGAGGKNGSVGPTLAGVGLKAGQVAFMVDNPQAIDKSSGMPKLPLTKKQIADIAAYVASLK